MPNKVDPHIREVEKIVRATSCPEDKKLLLATYLLFGEAEFWWMGAQQMMEARAKLVDWKSFRARFLESFRQCKVCKGSRYSRIGTGRNVSICICYQV